MKKIHKNTNQEKTRVHYQRNLQDDLIRFSFKYLDFSKKYPLKSNDSDYFRCFFSRLQSISQMKASEFRMNKDKSLRAHTHNWSQTSEPDGFQHLNTQLRQCEPWQFQLSANKHGRIHGILLDEVFYVVWFDPNHQLYP